MNASIRVQPCKCKATCVARAGWHCYGKMAHIKQPSSGPTMAIVCWRILLKDASSAPAVSVALAMASEAQMLEQSGPDCARDKETQQTSSQPRSKSSGVSAILLHSACPHVPLLAE